MVNNKTLSDVKIEVADRRVLYAHKFILYARCKSLKQFSDSPPGVTSRLQWHSDSYDDVRFVLHYIYTAELSTTVTFSNYGNVLRLSKRLQLPDLERDLDRVLEQKRPEELSSELVILCFTQSVGSTKSVLSVILDVLKFGGFEMAFITDHGVYLFNKYNDRQMSKVWLPEDRNNNVTLGTFGIQDGHAYVFDTFGTLRQINVVTGKAHYLELNEPRPPTALSVDDVNNNLYSIYDQHITVLSIQTLTQATIYTTTNTTDHMTLLDIAVGPILNTSYVFWSEFNETAVQIMRSNLDGSFVTTLATSGLRRPKHFLVDMNLQSLIWFDDDLLTMNIMKYDGTKRRILLNNVPKIVYASLDILDGYVYWYNIHFEIHRCTWVGNFECRHEDWIVTMESMSGLVGNIFAFITIRDSLHHRSLEERIYETMCTGISVGNNVCVEGRHITTSSAPIITSTPSTISTTYGIASTAHMDITTLQERIESSNRSVDIPPIRAPNGTPLPLRHKPDIDIASPKPCSDSTCIGGISVALAVVCIVIVLVVVVQRKNIWPYLIRKWSTVTFSGNLNSAEQIRQS